MALAISVTSALVGLGFRIMDSSICVAVITCFPCSSAIFIIFFCSAGTSSNGISTPISPLATIIPSDTERISSKFCIPCIFSILAITFIALLFSSRIFLSSRISSLHLTKEAAMKSYPSPQPKTISALSESLI